MTVYFGLIRIAVLLVGNTLWLVHMHGYTQLKLYYCYIFIFALNNVISLSLASTNNELTCQT